MSFFKNIITLMLGTVIAQAVPVAVSPILTRIYTPDDFGIFALFVSVTSVLTVVVSMRYELAILQPKEDEDAFSIVVLSSLVVLVMSFLTFLFACFYNFFGWNWFQNQAIGVWMYLLPLMMLVIGGYNVMTYWNLRFNNYKAMSQSRMIQGFTLAVTQLGVGSLSTNLGLIFGYFFSFITSLYFICRKKSDFPKIQILELKPKIISNMRVYKKMPLLSSVGALFDSASLQMPVFVIERFFGIFQTGIFSLTFRVLNLPMSLVSSALSQVFYKKVMNYVHDCQNHKILPFTLKIFFGLLLIVIPFGVFIWLLGEYIFLWFFGKEWESAGSMAKILVLAVIIRFAVSPLSTILTIKKNIQMGVLWQILYFMTISITLVSFASSDIQHFLYAYVVHEIILYTFYFILILRGVKNLQKMS